MGTSKPPKIPVNPPRSNLSIKMQPGAQKKAPVDVIEIGSSDDEDSVVPAAKGNNTSGGNDKLGTEAPVEFRTPKVELQTEASTSCSDRQQLEFRCFWKAGACAVGTSTSNAQLVEVEHARVHPKFLHSNATSHKWAFGAIAELLDNAVDEICNGATFVKVDRMYNKKDNSPALLIQDDGGGMSPDSIRKCMSLGYSSKTSNTSIGQYGNGFKTSTMRLGADVIVFSRASQSGRATQSVGLLSYTFLRRTGQDDVVVPMIDFNTSSNWAEPIIYSSRDDWNSNLKTILEWSPFSSKEDLMFQFGDIGSHGTKIIIYNLWLNDEGVYELSFDDDDEDIRLRDEVNAGNLQKLDKRRRELQSHISYCLRFSLRAYSSMLYMRKFTNFKILLRGKPVEQFNIVDELKYKKTYTYRPQLTAPSTEVSVPTTVGFIKEAPALGVCGFNVYHKNRLIRPFWKVTADGSSRGHGVVGVLEANFIEPAHDKQDFERSSLFLKLETRLKYMINDYWKDHCHLVGHQPIGIRSHNVTGKSSVPIEVGPHQLPTGKNVNDTAVIDISEADEENIREEERGIDGSMIDLDQIREENIQLSMRCEEYLQKENDLLSKVASLEKQLAETKAKSAKLSLHIEAQKLKLRQQPQQQI